MSSDIVLILLIAKTDMSAIKILGINKKGVNHLYTKNYKTLMKEI
jgi:hypothetical protein